ncbi:OLC1v1020504C2 [Oldenlandia corymbosa var. corymbosa]|uniref:OLC1v1020504C2 n=1 Tax=Oldenlandia corymbosa var. corymbosa TaxID=529605 RepID=A0AAV1EH56_OLDCO|nr:OLC1v1020504C2 [Oldenlandia corymbosa var. corymbosa]
MPRYPPINIVDGLKIFGQCFFRLDKLKALVKTSVELMPRYSSINHVVDALKMAWKCLFRPHKVKALANCFMPSSISVVDGLRIPGEIEAEVAEMGVEHFMKKIFTYGTPGPLILPKGKGFGDSPDTPVFLPPWLTEEDVAYYVSKFEKTGFTGGVNYYRALDLTWELVAPWTGAQVKVPAKFITGDYDLVYHMPGMQDYIHKGGFKSDVPLLEDVVVIKDAAHFINQEIPDEVSKHIYDFIQKF